MSSGRKRSSGGGKQHSAAPTLAAQKSAPASTTADSTDGLNTETVLAHPIYRARAFPGIEGYRGHTAGFPGELHIPCLYRQTDVLTEPIPDDDFRIRALYRLRGFQWELAASLEDGDSEINRLSEKRVRYGRFNLHYIGAQPLLYGAHEVVTGLSRRLAEPGVQGEHLPGLLATGPEDPIAYWLWSHDLIVTNRGRDIVALLAETFGPIVPVA